MINVYILFIDKQQQKRLINLSKSEIQQEPQTIPLNVLPLPLRILHTLATVV